MIGKFSPASVLKILKKKAGFTLIETITALFVLIIVATVASPVFMGTIRSYIRANEFAELSVLLNNLGKEITNDLNRATAAPAFDSNNREILIEANSLTIKYTVDENGILMKNNQFLLAPGYYRNKRLSVGFTQPGAGKPVYRLELNILDSDGLPMLCRTYSVNPIMLR